MKGLGCPHYKAMRGSRRCQHYWDGHSVEFDSKDFYPDLDGACDRDDMFMCVFWLAKYPYGYEDEKGRVHRVDVDGVIHITPGWQGNPMRIG
jgi:hypothetical protein